MPDRLQLYVYSHVGDWDVNASTVAEQLAGYSQADGVDVYINSFGGDFFEGIAIYNALVRSGLDVVTHVDGIAASIASVIAQAGRERRMALGSLMMIHNPTWWDGGDADDHERLSETLDTLGDTLAAIYEARSGTEASAWLKAMDKETWYTAQQAVAAGLADVVSGHGVELPEDVMRADDRAPISRTDGRLVARLVTPQRRPLVVNLFDPPNKPDPPMADPKNKPTTLLQKIRKALNLADDATDEDVEQAIEDLTKEEVKPETPPAPETPDDEGDDEIKAELAEIKNELKALRQERQTSARNAFDELFAEKVKTFAVAEADREKWADRFTKLGAETATDLLRDMPANALRPGGVRRPSNASGPKGAPVQISRANARNAILYRQAQAEAKEKGVELEIVED